jgi:hypothetical protein
MILLGVQAEVLGFHFHRELAFATYKGATHDSEKLLDRDQMKNEHEV